MRSTRQLEPSTSTEDLQGWQVRISIRTPLVEKTKHQTTPSCLYHNRVGLSVHFYHSYSDPEVKVVAVDLQDMAPIKGITQIKGMCPFLTFL